MSPRSLNAIENITCVQICESHWFTIFIWYWNWSLRICILFHVQHAGKAERSRIIQPGTPGKWNEVGHVGIQDLVMITYPRIWPIWPCFQGDEWPGAVAAGDDGDESVNDDDRANCQTDVINIYSTFTGKLNSLYLFDYFNFVLIHPIPSHPVPSGPTPSCFLPSPPILRHFIQSHPISTQFIPSWLILTNLIWFHLLKVIIAGGWKFKQTFSRYIVS